MESQSRTRVIWDGEGEEGMKWQRVVRIEVRRKGFVCNEEKVAEEVRRVVEWVRKEGRRATQSVLEEGRPRETRRGQLSMSFLPTGGILDDLAGYLIHLEKSLPSNTAPPSPSFPRPSQTALVPTPSSLSMVPSPPADSRPKGIIETSDSHTRMM